jgi:hypothetical protein
MGPYSYMALVRTGTLASVMPSVAIRTSNLQIVRRVTQYGAKATGSVAADFARVIDFDDSHVHAWFKSHAKARRKVEKAEWDKSAIWL